MLYTVQCYEKDGDVSTDMVKLRSKTRAITVAKSLYRICQSGGIRRRDNGEPYDWSLVIDTHGNTIWSPLSSATA